VPETGANCPKPVPTIVFVTGAKPVPTIVFVTGPISISLIGWHRLYSIGWHRLYTGFTVLRGILRISVRMTVLRRNQCRQTGVNHCSVQRRWVSPGWEREIRPMNSPNEFAQ